MFVNGSEKEVAEEMKNLERGRSILDTVSVQAKNLERGLGAQDRDRLEQYFTSVRDLESRLKASQGWELKPKPAVTEAAPVDPTSPAAYMEKIKVMYDLARLAFQTDSTRSITLMLDSVATPVVEGIADTSITETYHNLSHHGEAPQKLKELAIVEAEYLKLYGDFLLKLKETPEGDSNLLDRTMVLLA